MAKRRKPPKPVALNKPPEEPCDYSEHVYQRDKEWHGGRGGPECANDPPEEAEER